MELLRSESAQNLGIQRDPLVKIVSIKENMKHIPVFFENSDTLYSDINELKKSSRLDFSIEKLPWNDEWVLKRKNTSLHDNLSSILSSDILDFIPKSFDSIGSVAIIEIDRWGELSNQIPDEKQLKQIMKTVAKTILSLHPNIQTVLRKVGSIGGEFRVRKFEILAGNHQTVTIHKENNARFYVDPTTMFFSPRLSYERDRVACLAYTPNSTLIDCFAGCGPYSIQIARNHNVSIFGIEKNPEAFKYYKKNIALNKKHLRGTVTPFLGDFRDFHKSQSGKSCLGNADYIIMNLPENAHNFIPNITPFVKTDCTNLVFYTFLKSADPILDAESKLRRILRTNDLTVVEVTQKRIVFSYSPNQNNVGIDIKIKK